MWWTPAPSVEDLTEYEPAPLTTLTLRPSSRNVTFAIRRPLTVAFTVRPTQPEGPSSCDRPKTTFLPSTAPAGCTGGCAAAGAGVHVRVGVRPALDDHGVDRRRRAPVDDRAELIGGDRHLDAHAVARLRARARRVELDLVAVAEIHAVRVALVVDGLDRRGARGGGDGDERAGGEERHQRAGAASKRVHIPDDAASAELIPPSPRDVRKSLPQEREIDVDPPRRHVHGADRVAHHRHEQVAAPGASDLQRLARGERDHAPHLPHT